MFLSKPRCLVFSGSQSVLGISWGKKLSNDHNYRKIQKMVLKFKKIAENWKIKGFLKNSKCHKIWMERGIGLKLSGFASFKDLYQWSKFEANWRISISDLRWSWLDWPIHLYLCLLNILLCYIDYQVHNSNSISVFWFYILIKDGSLTRLIVPKSGSPRLSCPFILLKIVSNSNFIDIRLIIYQ